MSSSLQIEDSPPQAAGDFNVIPEYEQETRQLDLFDLGSAVVHFYDRNGALHTGSLLKKISRGCHRGQLLIKTTAGRIIKSHRIRNVEWK